jgi:site-specific recombinase XerD
MTVAAPTLIGELRRALRLHHYSPRTEEAYVQWVRRFIRFCGGRHPRELGAGDVSRFLTHLAVDGHVTASTQNQALAAIVFLYRDVLDVQVGWLANLVRAKRSERVPVVLTKQEVRRVLAQLKDRGTPALVVGVLYGTGMRLLEGLRLRV